MTALYIILGIIAFIVLVFSIRVVLIFDYEEDVDLWGKWLFIKFRLLPFTLKKKAKVPTDATSETTESATEVQSSADSHGAAEVQSGGELNEQVSDAKSDDSAKPATEPAAESATEPGASATVKKPSLLKQLYETHGFDGLLKMLQDAANALKGFLGKVFAAFVFDELYLKASVCGGDAADTAIKYGKVCEKLFPSLGAIVSTCKVKKYDVNVYPDFLGKGTHAKLHARISVRPIRLTNAAVVLLFKLLFKVVLKILFKKPKSQKINSKNVKGGASS